MPCQQDGATHTSNAPFAVSEGSVQGVLWVNLTITPLLIRQFVIFSFGKQQSAYPDEKLTNLCEPRNAIVMACVNLKQELIGNAIDCMLSRATNFVNTGENSFYNE